MVREVCPKATIFKAAHMTGVEDRLLNNFANLAKKLPFMPLVDGGHTLYQPTYVRDVTEAMMNSLKTPSALGQTYHLAGPETYTYAFSLSCYVAKSDAHNPTCASHPILYTPSLRDCTEPPCLSYV